MDRLPTETKCLIAEYIRDECKESLPALSLVNQAWSTIARPLLYEHIIVHVLTDDASHKFLWQPEASRVLVHIKRLSIFFRWYSIHCAHLAPWAVFPAYSALRATLQAENLDHKMIFKTRDCSTSHSAGVIDLIRKIPRLRDVDLLMSNGGPVELHEAIRQYHPSCRLSVYLNPQRTDRYRRPDDWVFSPQLHAAYVTLLEHPGRGIFREHPDRVLEDVLVRAPHVKTLVLQITAGGHAGPKPNFNETVVVEGRTLRAKLDQLAWPLNTVMPAAQFLKWAQLVDYSCLKAWTVGCIEDTPVLRAIANLRPFQQLNELTLALFPPQNDEPSFYTAAEDMFDSIPPLTSLCLLGTYSPSFLTPALRKHGPTLLELKLNVGRRDSQTLRRLIARGNSVTGPVCPVETIHSLAAHCAALQTLCIAIQRTRGLETPAYTALARFPALTSLELYLNCPPSQTLSPVPPRDLSEFENAHPPLSTNLAVPIWYLRDTLTSSAIDEDLAKAIFTHIRAHQVGDRRLAKLEIRPLYSAPAAAAQSISRASHNSMFRALASSWTVQSDLLYGVKAVEHMQKQDQHQALFSRLPEVSERNAHLKAIFESVWPPVEGQGEGEDDWLHRWRSWPLQWCT